MSIEIRIFTNPEYGTDAQQVDDAMAALGFTRATRPSPGIVGAQGGVILTDEIADSDGGTPAGEPTTATPTATRVPGQPSPGKTRRTKAEIAEDEASGNGNISTGGERADPENPDTPEVEAQDKADEQAEVDENRSEDKPLTIDDVKAAVNGYVEKFGLAATQEDGPKIFVEALGTPPAGQEYWKMSLLPDDQAKLAKVVAVWKRCTAENPLKREAV